MKQSMGKIIETTVSVTLTDASQTLTSAVDTALGSPVDWPSVTGALITVEEYDARIAFGVAASTTLGHVAAAGQSVRFPSADHIKQARVINAISGSNAVLQITLEG